MRQRLGLATTLLGDPEVLVLDEPGNGLDPAGVAWLRGFLRAFADAGRTVFVSSHLLAEMSQTVDRLVVIDRGRLVAEGPMEAITSSVAEGVVRSPDTASLAVALGAAGATVSPGSPDGGALSVKRPHDRTGGGDRGSGGHRAARASPSGSHARGCVLRITGGVETERIGQTATEPPPIPPPPEAPS